MDQENSLLFIVPNLINFSVRLLSFNMYSIPCNIDETLFGSIYKIESPYNSLKTGMSDAITGHLNFIASKIGIPKPS